ncbi:ORF129 [Ranid herpesvirus 2]|uniref:ORF129 n=1 Tax=Ranid herpesvirus 2 TaxID=389214 RepID=Q14VX7_9VIRU|nr:ORF129 [Ranid herpesvirus 2]ABG25600.1 ORF129 [Ranid herpesvirus 2]
MQKQEGEADAKLEVIGAAEEYARIQQQNFVKGVLQVFTDGPLDKDVIITLCGDAGTGKSHTLNMLEEQLKILGWYHLLLITTTTHAASAILCRDTPTIYSATCLNNQKLLHCAPVELDEELRKSNSAFSDIRDTWDANVEARLTQSRRHNHFCKTFSNRCVQCMKMYARYHGECRAKVFGKSIVVIDEMGMLDRKSLEKVIMASRFFNPSCGMVFILCGSISQLTMPALEGIWQSSLLEELWLGGCYLSYNFRLNQDYELADSLACMQHNVVTQSCKELLDACVIEDSRYTLCPEFKPEAVRIFNANRLRDDYNDKCLAYHVQQNPDLVIYDLSPTMYKAEEQNHSVANRAWNAFYARFNHVDRHKPLKLCVNTMVTIYRQPGIPYGQGTVIAISPLGKHYRLTIRRLGSNDKTQIDVSTFTNPKLPEIYHYPISVSHAINTFAAQGSTMKHSVIYCPPTKKYFTSKIKASAYVACTRVTKRKNLIISHNSFANTEGYAPFFTPQLLAFKEQYEMNYDYQ